MRPGSAALEGRKWPEPKEKGVAGVWLSAVASSVMGWSDLLRVVEVVMRAERMAAWDHVGWMARRRAAAAETWGQDMEVPE